MLKYSKEDALDVAMQRLHLLTTQSVAADAVIVGQTRTIEQQAEWIAKLEAAIPAERLADLRANEAPPDAAA